MSGENRLGRLAWFTWIHPSLNSNPVISDANPYVLSAVSPCLGPVPWLTSSRTYLHILKFQTSIRTNFLKVNCPEPAVVYFQGMNFGLQSRLLPTSFLLLKVIYDGILLRHKKECTWVSSSEVDVCIWVSSNEVGEPTQSEVSQKKKNKYCILTHSRWNLERWYWWTYLEGSNGDKDTENRHVDMGRGEEEEGRIYGESKMETCILPYVK